MWFIERRACEFPGGPVINNLPSSAGWMGLIPGQGTEIPRAVRQPSPHTETAEPGVSNREPVCCELQNSGTLEPADHNWRKACVAARKSPHAITNT